MTVTVALVGDTMLGRGVGRALATTPPEDLVAPEVRAALGEADLVVLNLECCISERGRPWDAPGKPFFFRAPPRAVELLALLGTDCVTLAYGVAAGRPAGSRRPLGGGRQPGPGVVSRAEEGCRWSFPIVSQGQSSSSTSARECSSCARSPVDAFFQPAYIFCAQPGRAPAGSIPGPMRGSSVRRVRHGALSGRRGRFATRPGR
jgi:hypothetical protein